MDENTRTMTRLLGEGRIALSRSPFLDSTPEPAGLPARDRVEGMLLGLAIGDALGSPVEGTLPSERKLRFGDIRHYQPNRWADGRRVGLPTDDTQLAFRTVEQALEDGGFDPARLAARFAGERIFGIGSGTREFVDNVRSGLAWEDCAARSAGNGALMRIAPALLPHLAAPSAGLWADVVLAARMTHDDPASTASCVAFADLLWKALHVASTPEPGFWASRFVEVARPLETAIRYTPRGGRWRDTFDGTLTDFVELALGEGRREGWSASQGAEAWWSGAFLLETVPTVLWILEKHAHDPEEAMVRAASDAKDADTAAAIVGAVVGALHGRSRLPARWLEKSAFPGRLAGNDDGRVLELVARAIERWA